MPALEAYYTGHWEGNQTCQQKINDLCTEWLLSQFGPLVFNYGGAPAIPTLKSFNAHKTSYYKPEPEGS